MNDVNFDLRGLIDNSLLEWEDHVAAVVVAGGCNLRCPYCHSWRYVTGLDDLEQLDAEMLFRLLKRQRGWIDGVVFTGGEPTLQPGLADMIRRTRKYGVKVKLHTNGANPAVVADLLDAGLLDCLALDYKAPLDGRFFAAAGIPNRPETLDAVRRTFGLAKTADVEREYHTTLNPRFVAEGDFTEMGNALERGGTWFLQQYESDDCLSPATAGKTRYTDADLERMADIARNNHGKVILKPGRQKI